MSIFYGGDVSLAANTATKIIDAAEVDRAVYISGVPTYLGFSSAEVTGRTSGAAVVLTAVPFVLPAGKELWGYNGAATSYSVLVTAVR